MKKILILTFLLGWAGISSAQTIHVANNNANAPSGNNIHATLQAAIDAASTGDVIHIVPSVTSYNDATIAGKKLMVLGIGFNPNKDQPVRSTVNIITLSGEGASGSRLAGLTAKRFSLEASVHDIAIENCYFPGGGPGGDGVIGNIAPHNNIVIRNCVFENRKALDFRLNQNDSGSNLLITNNIFFATDSGSLSINNYSGTIVSNNLFVGPIDRPSGMGSLTDAIFQDNVLVARNISSFSRVSFIRNLVYLAADPAIPIDNDNSQSENIVGQNPDFINFPTTGATSFSTDLDFRLQDGSPGKGKGDGGADIGIFGGANPFDPTGTPLPYVQRISVPSAVKKGTDMTVTIRARGN